MKRKCNLVVGDTFGKLTFRSIYSGEDRTNSGVFICSCGKEKIIGINNVLSGGTVSCGCQRNKNKQYPIGTKWYRLTLLEYTKCDPGQLAKFKCDCGKEIEVQISDIKSKNTRSCGCLHSESAKQIGSITGKKNAKLDAGLSSVWGHYTTGARRRRILFSLTKEQFKKITSSNCHYCNSAPSQIIKTKSGNNYKYNGIDRLDSNIGYELTNCIPCCKQCNYMKLDYTAAEFLEHIKKIYCYMSR